MKLSLRWLKNYVAIAGTPEKLAGRLTLAGQEVKKIENIDGDTVFEIEVTPNRPDCLNVLGLAREVSAVFNKPLKIPSKKMRSLPKQKADIAIRDPKGCQRYVGAVIKSVNVSSARTELQRDFNSMGIRSINNVVDITNFCLMDLGQPLHAFDFDKLVGGKIVVRRAQEGERLVTLDGVERVLDPSILVIADAKRPVAIAGIMGGKETEVTDQTKNVLLESAYFDPVLIRRACRKLGLSSDSSYRFERGVDFNGVQAGALRAIALILRHAGGKVVAFSDQTAAKPATRKSITVTKPWIESRLGASVSWPVCQNILKKLGCSVRAHQKSLKITSPSFRTDLKSEVDVLEELARIIGYDRLPASLPQIKVSSMVSSAPRAFRRSLAGVLQGLGFREVVTYAMTNCKELQKCGCSTQGVLKVKNPLSFDQELMRPSLLPTLLAVVVSNINRGQKDLRLFEMGNIYSPAEERMTCGVILTGQRTMDWRLQKKEPADFYDLKGAIERVLDKARILDIRWKIGQEPFFVSGLSAQLFIRDQPAGFLGSLSPAILDQWDIKQSGVLFAQLDMEKFFQASAGQSNYGSVPEIPAIIRDISLAVKFEVKWEDVLEVIQGLKIGLIHSIKFIEEYLGEKIPAGHRGLIFSLVYQSPQRTLREEEVTDMQQRVCLALAEKLGAIRR